MFQTKYDTSEYYDFHLVFDREDERKLGDYLEVDVDFSASLMSSIGKVQNEEVLLKNITLNGLDNFFIKDGLTTGGTIDHTKTYTVQVGDRFQLWPVSGYTKDLDYSIVDVTGLKKLSGGFYQGFYKLHEYPVEFFNTALAKGWTANLTLFHNPTAQINTLNELYPNNAGFIFYLGTRAENKYFEMTDVELARLKTDYALEMPEIQTTMATLGDEFTLSGQTYEGHYNFTDGQYWTGDEKNEISQRLEKEYNYEDVIDNAFGIRVHPDGRIGYRLMTGKECDDVVVTGDTTNPYDGVDGYLWVDKYDACEDVWRRVLVTPKYKVIEEYSKLPVMNDKINKYANVTVVFERYFPVTNICQLKYSKFRKGTLKIFVNGIRVLSAFNVDEVFTRELDAQKELQEGVPYIMSVGGGTQGLLEAVYLDPEKTVDGVLEKYFAGTYTGSVKRFSFYTTPANVVMVRDKARQVLNDLNIPINFGGRKIILY